MKKEGNRGERIRTSDLLVPNHIFQFLRRKAPHPKARENLGYRKWLGVNDFSINGGSRFFVP
jgi:hypothetical protein